MFCSFLFSSPIFSHCSNFPIISFFAKNSNRRARAGPDRTDTGGNKNAGETREAKSTCYVFFSLLYVLISSSCSFSFPIVYSITISRAQRGGAGQDVTRPTREKATARGRTGEQTGGVLGFTCFLNAQTEIHFKHVKSQFETRNPQNMKLRVSVQPRALKGPKTAYLY